MSPDNDFPAAKFDQALDPPEYPERYLPVSDAPFEAILRAVDDWVDDDAVDARNRVMQAMCDALRAIGRNDVDVTEEEWQAHCRAILEQTQER